MFPLVPIKANAGSSESQTARSGSPAFAKVTLRNGVVGQFELGTAVELKRSANTAIFDS